MDELTPHKTLLALHRPVDAAVAPLLVDMGLEPRTEGIVTVDASALAQLGAGGDPQAALLDLSSGPGDSHAGLVIAEPGLCNRVLERIWRSARDESAPLTHME